MATTSRNDRASGNHINDDVLTVVLPSEKRDERRQQRKPAKHGAPSVPIVALVPVDAQSLVERLAEAQRDERADLLLDALAADSVPDLAGADLRELDLAGAAKERATRLGGSPRLTLDGADLSGAILSGARLAGASFRGARLDDALMVGTDLRGADLAGASLRSAHLSGADLTRADLSFCDLRGASLLTAELANAVATGADLRETLLHSANLTGAMLRGVDLRWARLNGARLVNVDLRGVRFGGARLTLADLSGARVSDSTDFSFAFLYWTRLDRVALTRDHLGGGIGESVSDHSLARDTYLALMRHFAGDRRRADARWAYSQASSMGTATHRPDRARKYYPRDWASTEDRNATDRRRRLSARLRDMRSTTEHCARWLAGHASRLTTDHGDELPSYRRNADRNVAFVRCTFPGHGRRVRHSACLPGTLDTHSVARRTPVLCNSDNTDRRISPGRLFFARPCGGHLRRRRRHGALWGAWVCGGFALPARVWLKRVSATRCEAGPATSRGPF